MSSNYSVSLLGPAPWGFRLQGGKDFNMPLTISRLTDGGKAAKAHLAVGDVVLSIDGIAADGMNHLEAQNKIKTCAGKLNLTLQKASSVPKPPVAPKPSVYNTPINLYSNENACEVAMGQRRGLLESQGEVTQQHNGGPQSILNRAPVMPTKQTDIEFYHVPSHGDASKTRIIEDTEDWRPRAGTSQSRSFRILAQITGTEHEQGQQSDAGKKTKRALPLNPLEFLPRSAPCPPPLTASAYSHGAVSRVPIVNCTQPSCSPTQRGSGPAAGAVSPSLLDALLITPISKSPPLRLRKKKRRSASALNLSTSKSEEVEEPQPNAHATCPVKTMVKAPAGSPRNTAQGPAFPKAGGQMGLITPTFGVVSSSCPIAPILDRPVPRPHPKDDDSLVQMAEHIPAGTRTPMCGHCNMVIRGPFLVAMGKSWHPEEFNCVHCRTSLADIGFVEEQSSVYCEHCYEEFFAPSCGRCQHKILGEVINALKQTWHVYCFLCSSCQQPIRNNTFHLEDGEPYCEQDYYNLFGTSCRGCDFPIEAGDKFLEALGFMWHDTCFVCVVCCTSLEGQTFFSKKDKPLCKKHANTVKM